MIITVPCDNKSPVRSARHGRCALMTRGESTVDQERRTDRITERVQQLTVDTKAITIPLIGFPDNNRVPSEIHRRRSGIALKLHECTQLKLVSDLEQGRVSVWNLISLTEHSRLMIRIFPAPRHNGLSAVVHTHRRSTLRPFHHRIHQKLIDYSVARSIVLATKDSFAETILMNTLPCHEEVTGIVHRNNAADLRRKRSIVNPELCTLRCPKLIKSLTEDVRATSGDSATDPDNRKSTIRVHRRLRRDLISHHVRIDARFSGDLRAHAIIDPCVNIKTCIRSTRGIHCFPRNHKIAIRSRCNRWRLLSANGGNIRPELSASRIAD